MRHGSRHAALVSASALFLGACSLTGTTATVNSDSETETFVIRTTTLDGSTDRLLEPHEIVLAFRGRQGSDLVELLVLDRATCRPLSRVTELVSNHVYITVDDFGQASQEPWDDPSGAPSADRADDCEGR